MYCLDQLLWARMNFSTPIPGTRKSTFIAQEPAREGRTRIANCPKDLWLKGFMKPINISSDRDWDQLYSDIRTENTQSCDVQQECRNGVFPLTISYGHRTRNLKDRMSDIQFNNLKFMVRYHFGYGEKVSFWLDNHMSTWEERKDKDWMTYGTTAYRNSIVCYLPNVDLTRGCPDPRLETAIAPVNISTAFQEDIQSIWVAFELRRATQGVGLMCGTTTNFGESRSSNGTMFPGIVLDSPVATMHLLRHGFAKGGGLTDGEASDLELADVLTGRMLGISEYWDNNFVIATRARLMSNPPNVSSTKVRRYRHMSQTGNYELSARGEYENDRGLPYISICDIGSGSSSGSSHIIARKLPENSLWNKGALLIAGQFTEEDKKNEVALVPMRYIATDPSHRHDLWLALVSTKHAEKYCCVVVDFSIGAVVKVIDVWPVNSNIYDLALAGRMQGGEGVLAHLDKVKITSEPWWVYLTEPRGDVVLAPNLLSEWYNTLEVPSHAD